MFKNISLDKKIESVRKVIIHPEYWNTRYKTLNDICLVKTAETLDLDGIKAKPVYLPASDDTIFDENCEVAGWGKTENGWQSAVVLKGLVHFWYMHKGQTPLNN